MADNAAATCTLCSLTAPPAAEPTLDFLVVGERVLDAAYGLTPLVALAANHHDVLRLRAVQRPQDSLRAIELDLHVWRMRIVDRE